MSTPMDDNFYTSDMNDYPCLQQYNGFEEKSFHGNMDPRLLSSPNSPMTTNNSESMDHFAASTQLLQPNDDYPFYNAPMIPSQAIPSFFDPDMTLANYEPLRHQLLGHRRSVSQPPEELLPEVSQPAMVFHRGGTPLGDSMAKTPKSGKRLVKKAVGKKGGMARQSPYPMSPGSRAGERLGVKRAHTTQPVVNFSGPTSAPGSSLQMPYLQDNPPLQHHFDMTQLSSPRLPDFAAPAPVASGAGVTGTELADIDILGFASAHTNADTAVVVAMLGFADRVARDAVAMREYLARGFGSNVGDGEVERIRNEKRALNHGCTSLSTPLEVLPLPAAKVEESVEVPKTGAEIRDMDAEKTNALLQAYDIPFATGDFLFDKKMAWLRFLGAGGALMHAVLD